MLSQRVIPAGQDPTHLILYSMEGTSQRDFLSLETINKSKVYTGGQVSAQAGSRIQQLWPHGSECKVNNDTEKGYVTFLHGQGKPLGSRHLAGKSLHGGLEKTLHGAVKVKPGLS